MPEASASRSGASSSSDNRGASSNSDGALEPDEDGGRGRVTAIGKDRLQTFNFQQATKAATSSGAPDAEVLASTRQWYLDAFAALASRDFGEPIDARDKRGWTPLTYVCRHATALGDEFISAVLDAGADVDHPCARGTPALVHAAAADSAAAAAALLSRGADVSARDAEGWTAAMVAAFRNPANVRLQAVLIDRAASS